MGLLDNIEAAKKNKANPTPAEPATPPSAPAPSHEQHIPAVDMANKNNRSKLIKKKLRQIDPARCRPWSMHNRNTQWWLTPGRSQGLMTSIKEHGQTQPGLVRAIDNSDDYDYEIIFGLRRWYACSQIGAQYLAEVINADDITCSQLMLDENEQSKDISELEKCFSMASQVGTIFKNANKLAESLGVSKQIVARRLAAAKLQDYPPIMDLLNPVIVGVSTREAKALVEYLSRSKTNLDSALAIAKTLPPASLDTTSNIDDAVGASKLEANRIINRLMVSPKRATPVDNKRVTTYLATASGKQVVGLTDFGNGKVSLTLNTHHMSSALENIDAQEIIQSITDDLLAYFK